MAAALRRAAAPAALLALAACAGHAPRGGASAPRGLPPAPSREDHEALRERRLVVPVAGVALRQVASSFADPRGDRVHLAIDLLAPRGTPVLSADDGRIWKLRSNALGGITVYATDPEERFVYYYAHLDRYRTGLAEGARVTRGDTLGFVGTTGNAPANVPHLHFQVARLGPDRRWWTGTPIDPLPYLREAAGEPPRAVAARPRAAAPRPAPAPARLATRKSVPRPTVPALAPDSAAATDSLLVPALPASAVDGRAAGRGPRR